ncbi:dTDP-glucose 4,6-dehydratase [bacterium (Candidatus Blackallbacteria) CG17_big_fil_post_rev_8_21_14_2_50_48_46]|uniref:dTDP-glucose 4,6-dehydratase n=1 Tax=bacterium (Candidatus Blackallbacteria) CG17_big_fil_post_rev_8_21_14_2_50_48_46 TaxID=2014261 RepID=A0A2M7FZL9_9BACT|nr:MAG: dTDP-glucose 4,6-dehydratase [bacterium (Candidatus Blackallbacteria) CG18_big_fil_WC_8_21_14_2_50_49_26]PIW14323.1 MAG: dTDP-glucose 4,6-dehydratase [bacterium (Candidatus Blackallbacteria) CG17_big_fil_post_rev_8_21_14_2_50_48_46]PIW45592.1 MAG: dTDP-glucose 4,6-dehydratase [bacterium (Candidatus Blackallbacteria) CG13_big_fil_rev_8_21_14_2_50_49_14]
MTRVLITGAAGFIGSNFVDYALRTHPDWQLTNLDLLTYAGFPANIEPFQNSERYRFVQGNVCDPQQVNPLVAEHDLLIHFAAESNVDLSIVASGEFIRTNIEGTRVLLEACRQTPPQRILVVSTDEVYGNAWQDRPSLETDPLMPCSPYAASKAGQDLLAFGYYETYGLPIVRTRCSNNYGPRQDPTKLIPRFILQALHDQPLPVYGHGQNTRDWIHVQDHCRAIDAVLHSAPEYNGEVFNIGADCEKNVLEISRTVLNCLGISRDLLQFVPDRLGHVRRHAVNSEKIQSHLGWQPQIDFATGIAQTVKWYLENPQWWRAVVQQQAQQVPGYSETYGFDRWLSENP